MNSLLNEHGEELEDFSGARDREITLGTSVVLGIFFGLAVICAVFFGFGYSVGVKHNLQTADAVGSASSPSASFSSFKPSPGSPASGAGGGAHPLLPETAEVPETAAVATPPPVAHPQEKAPTETAIAEPAIKPAAKLAPASPPAAPPVPASASQLMVQIAAVSHQEDADLLVSSLKRRNYNVIVHQESQDKLLHVQVGPFGNRKDADAMRQRLQSDGFNAIVKELGH